MRVRSRGIKVVIEGENGDNEGNKKRREKEETKSCRVGGMRRFQGE